MKAKITKRVVDGLLTPAGKRSRLWDTEIKGFGVVAYPTGARVFVCRYTLKGNTRQATIGEYGSPWTVAQARQRAIAILAAVAKGRDPIDESQAHRRMPSFGEWAHDYVLRMTDRKKSVREDRRYLLTVAKPWHKRPLDGVTSSDVAKLFEVVTRDRGPTTANRALASWRACFADAWRREMIDTNPCSRVRANSEPQPRERVLSADELARFFAAVEGLHDPHMHAAFRLLIGTGCRISELLHARWADLDLPEGLWLLPQTKSGKAQRITLTADLVELLRKLPRVGRYVIPGRDPNKPRSDLKTPWRKLCAAAQLDDLHVHDLRRSYGLLVARKVGIRAASRVLRHSDIRVTSAHYAPMLTDEAREITDKVAEVLPLRRVKAS